MTLTSTPRSDCRGSLPWDTRQGLVGTVRLCHAAAAAADGGRGAALGAPAPSSDKQGFSGFLGGTANNPSGFLCADSGAVGLGRPTSWFYTVRARPGRLRALGVSRSKSVLYGAFRMGAQGA